MLIIYSALSLGGIETFFVRFAKQRFLEGKKTKFILYTPLNCGGYNMELIKQLHKYAEVYHFDDIFLKSKIHWRFYLLHKLNLSKLYAIASDCSIIHVADAFSGLLASKILSELKLSKPITFGIYHAKEFTWGDGGLPYFERVNRNFVFNVNSSKNLLCYSNVTKENVEKKIGCKLNNAKNFRLGVIEKSYQKEKKFSSNSSIRICSVGRLAPFKTYNFWMPEVVRELRDKGVNVILDIFGSGECEENIKNIVSNYSDCIRLKPAFDYSEFSKIVSSYDLFVGSGTAIVEAASLGVPSVIGIESIEKPLTYGFFCDFSDYEYHALGLPFKLKSVADIIYEFYLLDIKSKNMLSEKHKKQSEKFLISECVKNFEIMQVSNTPEFYFNKFLYTFSYNFFHKKNSILRKSIYHDY